jgi:signal transduction histidine kinase
MGINTTEKDSDYTQILNYQCIFANLVDIIVMLDLQTKASVWMSERFKKIFPQIQLDSSIEHVCDVIGNNKKDIELLDKYINLCIEKGLEIYRIKCNEYEVEICSLNGNVIVIRLHYNQNSNLAQTRYLEDRERLLFTSRSITVSEMASTLAHEINQPIGTINNLLYGIRGRLSKIEGIDDDVFLAIDKSMEQTKFTADIISRIRDYTQSRQPKISNIKLKKLIDKCVSLMDWEMRYTNVEIEHFHNNQNTTIIGDELMLQQVLVNLIRNGMDANNESKISDSKIKITTSVINDYAEISIEDNGKGLTKKEAENLFIPFASNKSTGMGIGLNICRSFIELHKGKLWLTRNEQRGCTSHIMLPLKS